MTTTVIDTNGAVPMIYYMLLADIVALIVATILAAPLRARDRRPSRDRPDEADLAAFDSPWAPSAPTSPASSRLRSSPSWRSISASCSSSRPALDFSGINSRAIVMGLACSAGLVRDAVRRHDVAPPLVRRRARDSLGRSSSSSACSRIIHPSNVRRAVHSRRGLGAGSHHSVVVRVIGAMPDST